MRIVMLGWELPPHHTGGLGVACQGLLRALSRQGANVRFVMPRPPGRSAHESRVELIDMQRRWSRTLPAVPTGPAEPEFTVVSQRAFAAYGDVTPNRPWRDPPRSTRGWPAAPRIEEAIDPVPVDLVAAAERFAEQAEAAAVAGAWRFDVLHAHDWLTVPAGLRLARRFGTPLIWHVHSTEEDRAGPDARPDIAAIERQGMRLADRVIAVSHHTRVQLERRYDLEPERVSVVYHGVEPAPSETSPRSDRPTVLFLGRVTRQKSPEVFLRAALEVKARAPEAQFIVAGSGDAVAPMEDLVDELGLGDDVRFAGFVGGSDVDVLFRDADVFVMPSISEPFGLTPLEAAARDVPVLLSRSTGAREVLPHALSFEFWNVRDLADKILAVLQREPLRRTLRDEARRRVARLSWDDSARQCLLLYREAKAHHLRKGLDDDDAPRA